MEISLETLKVGDWY